MLAAGIHLQFWNKIRRRASFIYIGQSVYLQKQNRRAQHLNDRLIRARMPLSVYQEFLGRDAANFHYGGRSYYIRTNAQLTILVVELTNFNQMEEKYTLPKLVRLLTLIVDHFDKLAAEHMCERLSTRPHEFIYTSGISKVRPHHARSCTELAIDMLRTNSYFNLDPGSSFIFRMGVHSGKGTVVIWASDMLPYDILTTDIQISQRIKDFGSPGQVLVSQTTYSRISEHFNSKLVGQIRLDPYFTVLWPTYPESNSNPRVLRVYRIEEDDEDTLQVGTSLSSDVDMGLLGQVVKLTEHNRLHNRQQLSLVNRGEPHLLFLAPCMPRLSVFSLAPKRESTARRCSSFIQQTRWNTDREEVMDAEKHHEIDAQVLRLVTELRADPKHQIGLMQYVPLGRWTNLFINPELEWHYETHVQDTIDGTGHRFYGAMVSFRLIAVVNHMMATTSPLWLTCVGIVISFVAYLIIHQSFIQAALLQTAACMPEQAVHEVEIFISDYIMDVFISFVMIWIMGCVNDRNCRLNFLCMRELQICREETERFGDQLYRSLGQILPLHLVRFIFDQRIQRTSVYSERCSSVLNNVGIATLYISNIYTRFSQLPPQEWHLALRVINLAMCAFDDLLQDKKFDDLSYVRNSNGQLVIASGLEQFMELDSDDTYHLDRLLEFCLAAQRVMNELNEEHLRDIPQIHLKIGYTRGTVNTAIVGSEQPFYAIWGLPLHISARVAESGHSGEVQTTVDCTDLVSSHYEVIFSNVIAIDNIGLLETFVVRAR
ncbi:unnamed protein product [Echinostoma caproni]|uniref:adenylate cyclase n=1 Tax=Echinostoma caproni TaxID=27848 RepID=A0A183AVN2_9TREM|nr:unnamed protein product [Echinostoma caproni]